MTADLLLWFKMSRISSKLNKKELFEDLQTALEADRDYWLRNDAKLKAVVTAKTYDEFRESVAAAHLTPLTKQDTSKRMSSWNSVARSTSNKE